LAQLLDALRLFQRCALEQPLCALSSAWC
jgi:hypothetical protein